jgi:hypothetical protein
MVGNGDLTKQSIDLNISIAAVYNYMKENVESAFRSITLSSIMSWRVSVESFLLLYE